MTLTGVEQIEIERLRHINGEGFDAKRDDEYTKQELLCAAITYALQTSQFAGPVPEDFWPWNRSWWKPSDDPIRNLIKAGALIAAEIDRLQRVDR